MKTKTLKDKNGNPIQIELWQVRGLEEALANIGGIHIFGFLIILGICSIEVPNPCATKPFTLFSL